MQTAVTIGWIPFVLWVGWRNSSPQPTLIKQVSFIPTPPSLFCPLGSELTHPQAHHSPGLGWDDWRIESVCDAIALNVETKLMVVNRQSTVSKPLNAVNSTRYSGVLYRFTDLLTTVWRGFTLCHR
jgi:hypothetical protein